MSLESPEGERLFAQAAARSDYLALSARYVTQQTQGFCAVASAVMALNALQVLAPAVPAWDPFHAFTQDNVFNAAARRAYPAQAVNRGGMTLDQLADLLRCHPAQARVVHASDTTLDEFRREAERVLAAPGDFLIVNYDRAGLGMETMGHVSPLGAYNAAADKLLLMDVARYKYPPHWVDAAALFRAMNTYDPASGRSRGYLVVIRAAAAPGPSGARARNMFHLLLGVIAAAFVAGLLLGATFTTLWTRRRARA